MQILRSIAACKRWRASQGGSVGFVPTMGALHLGHLSLVQLSKQHCAKTIVSIYINPAQFSPNEDLGSYPKTLEQDLQCLKQEGADAAFVPTTQEMYAGKKDEYFFDCSLSYKLEGRSRPHFFTGVTTVVHKLFSIVQPTHTVFGKKDAQQLLIIKKMIEQNKYGIMLLEGPTVRSKNGLAFSSRNNYLSKEEKNTASNLFGGLQKIKKALQGGEKNVKDLKLLFINHLNKISGFKIDYISIACKKTLDEIDSDVSGDVLVSTAVLFKGIRLIDNFSYFPST